MPPLMTLLLNKNDALWDEKHNGHLILAPKQMTHANTFECAIRLSKTIGGKVHLYFPHCYYEYTHFSILRAH